MKRKVGYGFCMLKQRMRSAAAACAGHSAPTPTLPHLPTLPQLPALPQQVRSFTSLASTEQISGSYSVERLVHSTSSHTVFNGRLNGKPMSFFEVSNVIDVLLWRSHSVRYISENFLRIEFPVQNSKGSLFFTERVECTLKEYLVRFPIKTESLNPTAIIPEIRHVLEGILDLFLKCPSNQYFSHIHLTNLYWTGSKVVGVMFREDPSAEDLSAEYPSAEYPSAEDPSAEYPSAEDPSAEDPSAEDPSAKDPSAKDPSAKDPSAKDPSAKDTSADVDALKATFTEMFDGRLPACLAELLTQIDKKSLPLQYLLENHYSRMGSEERISYRTYVVRNILEGSVRSGNMGNLDSYWKSNPICQHVQQVAWKNSLGGTYGSGSNANRWNRQPEDPIQYLIMARNIGEHHSHCFSASQIDAAVTVTYPGHADAILVCIHALHPHLNFVKLKGK